MGKREYIGVINTEVGVETKRQIEELAKHDERTITSWLRVFADKEHKKVFGAPKVKARNKC
jgi:hypothetical protein